MRTSLAVKIFLSFWVIHAVIFVVLGLVPDHGADAVYLDHARHDAELAVQVLEREGPGACTRVLDAATPLRGYHAVLLGEGRQIACGAAWNAGAALPLAAGATAAGTVAGESERRRAALLVRGPSGRAYTLVAERFRDLFDHRPPVPYGFLVTATVVSGVVCLLLARNLARPLQRMRTATHRLTAGDLSARAGAGFEGRTDEIGDVVRDFDAMAERIESLLHAQRQLLSDISHELRSPLARLNVALELARRTVGQPSEAHLARISSEAERMNELVGRLLALSRAETTGNEGHTEEFDLEEVVRRVADDAQYEAHRANKSVALSAHGRAVLHGDPVLVASAVENVVRNAVKYAPPQTVVEITTSVTDNHAAIVVRDHGRGVPEAELERVFLPFHRVDAARDRESGGTGLGLSIARRAAASQGGTIQAANGEGGGLEVTITLPLAAR